MTHSRRFLAALCLTGPLSACAGECSLDDDLRLFAGAGAHDCGTAPATGERADVDDCVSEQFAAGAAFIARYEQAGDSTQLLAVAQNREGELKLFQYSEVAGPATDVQSCEEPALRSPPSDDPQAVPFTCATFGLAQRICG